MDNHVGPQDAPGAPLPLRLASAWADFTKALSIYPPTNTRVQAQRDAFLEALADALGSRPPGHDRERGLSILFHDTQVHLDETDCEVPAGTPVPWLRERLAHAGLAGVEFMTGVQGDALVDFTQRLLANFLRKESGLGFEELWPETYPGLVLVDLRFEGTFGGAGGRQTYRGGHGGGGGHAGAGTGTGSGTGAGTSETNHFVRGLLAHPKIARRIAVLATQTADDETTGSVDFLTHVLDEVPAEALANRDALIQAVCRVLDGLSRAERDTPTARDDGGLDEGSGAFADLLYQVSRRHFGRKGPGLERLRPAAKPPAEGTPGGGRKRDDAIRDDPRALVDEIANLPGDLTYDFARGEADSEAEQLATLLHFVAHLDRPEKLPGLAPLLGRLTRAPGRKELALLRTYLSDDVPGLPAGHARGALVRFLIKADSAHVLRICGVVTPAFVYEDPVAHLPIYLAATDADTEAARAELDEICATLGTDILEHDDALRAPLAALPLDRVRDVLARPISTRVPLVRLLLGSHPGRLEPDAVAFLRGLDLQADEAFVLFEISDPSVVSRACILGLLDLLLGRVDPTVVQSAINDLLCRYIRSVAWDDPTHAERLAAIRNLARYPSERGVALLKELQKSVLGPIGASEPGEVRKLARAVLKQMRYVRPDVPLDSLRGPSDRSRAA